MDVPVAVAGNGDGQMIPMKQRKAMMAHRYIMRNAPKIEALAEGICTGDKSTFTDYEALVGPVPLE